MSLLRSLLPPSRSVMRAQSGAPVSFDEWVSMFGFGQYPLALSPLGGKEERIADSFAGLVQGASRANGVVFACELARIMLFSEARFQFRERRSGRPGELFGTGALRILEEPSPGRTTGDMLTRAMQHADYGGTAFLVRRRRRTSDTIRQPRPDWVTILLGSETDPDVTGDDLDAEVIGLLYHPGGRGSGEPPVALLPEDVAIFAPIPDPLGKWRGVPWITPVIRNIMGHNAATTHKLGFYERGATPQIIVSIDRGIADPAKFRTWVETFEQNHAGATNSYRTLYLALGAKAEVVGSSLSQLDFKATQGADETLIAAAAGVPPVVVGLSEGLQGSSLNAGNFDSAMRRFADLTMRPAWRNMAGSLQRIVPPPDEGSELWYDDRDIPALKDDIKDAAEVQGKEAQSIRQLIDSGWIPESVKEAVISGDWTRLEHSGLFSVQLQPPGSGQVESSARVLPAEVALLGPGEVRCPSCNKFLARALGPGSELDCPRCKAPVTA
jgi:phage portal protein BeeE